MVDPNPNNIKLKDQFKDYPTEPTGFMIIDRSDGQPDIIVKYKEENNMNTMQCAIGVKMIAFMAMTRGEYDNYTNPQNGTLLNPGKEGYLIEYLGQGNKNHENHDNYISWTPKDIFEQSYYPIEDPTKITRNDVQGFIVPGEPMQLGEKTTIVMDSTLTGFDTIATSACVDPKNFSLKIGAEIARKDITDKIWGHLGFVLQWAKNGLKAKSSIPDWTNTTNIKLAKEVRGENI